MHPMTKDEFEQYRLLVQRKGKAMTIPAELRLGKYGISENCNSPPHAVSALSCLLYHRREE